MRRARPNIPSFYLYGEAPTGRERPHTVHIEHISARSTKYLGQIGNHRHPSGYQCVLVTSGVATVTLEDSGFPCEGPIAVIVPAGLVHGFRFRTDTRGFVLTVRLDDFTSAILPTYQRAIDALFVAPRIIDLRMNMGLAARAASLLECLLLEQNRQEGLSETVTSSLVCCALWTVAEAAGSLAATGLKGGTEWGSLREFRALVDRHYASHWSVERYADQLGMSSGGLNRLCHRLAGHSSYVEIQQRLVLEARRHLLGRRSSVAAIAEELGFKDPAYFSRFFRRHCGLSPTIFRRK